MQPRVLQSRLPASSDLPVVEPRTNADEVSHQQAGDNHSKRLHATSAHPERYPQRKARKRRKKSTQSNSSPALDFIRSQVHKSAEILRRDGISPDTLFFSALPEDMRRDENLRSAVGVPLEDLKTTHVRGKKTAWAKFPTESDCLDTLVRLRLSNPALKVSIHRPKRTTDPNGVSLLSNNRKTFLKRLEEVRGNGGVGNTLMFRNLPIEVECDELREVLRGAIQKVECQDHYLPLRIRTALSKNGNGRNFWVVYSSVSACQAAFAAVHLTSVSFRCGRTINIHAFVHDDSTDADEKRRRERAIDLGVQGSAPGFEMHSSIPKMSNLDLLENFLRQNQTTFVFMPP